MSGEMSNNNDVDPAIAREPDAHGQAALLLVESLIHGLIESKVISVATAVEIVDVATEVKIDLGEELGEAPENLQKSVQLLQAIGDSLKPDILAGK